MKSRIIILAIFATIIGCNKKQRALIPNNIVAKEVNNATMSDYVSLLINENYWSVNKEKLDSLRDVFTVLSFPKWDSIASEESSLQIHFGIHNSEKDRLDLTMYYKIPVIDAPDTLIYGEVVDCIEGRNAFEQTKRMLLEKLGQPKMDTWTAGDYVISIGIINPDTTCYAVTITSGANFNGDYD